MFPGGIGTAIFITPCPGFTVGKLRLVLVTVQGAPQIWVPCLVIMCIGTYKALISTTVGSTVVLRLLTSTGWLLDCFQGHKICSNLTFQGTSCFTGPLGSSCLDTLAFVTGLYCSNIFRIVGVHCATGVSWMSFSQICFCSFKLYC